ncbi:hypothetical protein GCM10016455_12510 [Aliiroseovarius zhejiangensis]|uniref:DUF6782 domain-containing protein n=1 Tax=Aliiroseovarius zhejiangensis TaxID=1632025 RepID=A0ABQ3ITN5_9RHOB|nr:DUF6782 family putative metallopeptidase [Aliiroseovarius zhejiangensis]GHE93815.1 hypothetical protein GCM10016455_12510 [Aliiroseovarius zhejiangensis]
MTGLRIFLAAMLVVVPTLGHAQGIQPARSCFAPTQMQAETKDQMVIAGMISQLEPVIELVFTQWTSQPQLRPSLCLVDHSSAAIGEYLSAPNTIYLRRDMPAPLMQGIMLHELRHADQYLRGFCPSNDVSMQENARAVAAIEADASAISLLAAWRLSKLGRPDTWAALAAWPMQRDIATIFEQRLSATLDPVDAVSAAFAQWYRADGRWNSYYVSSCSDYLDRQDDGHLLPSYATLPDDFLKKLCIMPGGERYPCSDANWHDRFR